MSTPGCIPAYFDPLIYTIKALIISILLSTIIVFASHATALPTLSLNLTDLDSNVAAIKTGVNCWPSSLRGSRLADTRDCLQAALLLPDGSDPGDFHLGNPMNDFHLPVVVTHQSCTATVSLSPGTRDRSSWDHISYVASQMGAICSIGQYPIGKTGGVTNAGTRNSIRVSLEKAVKVGDVSSQ